MLLRPWPLDRNLDSRLVLLIHWIFILHDIALLLVWTRLKLRTASAEHPQQKANSNCCARASKPSPFLRGQCLDLRITHMVWWMFWLDNLTSETSQVEACWSTPRRASSKRRCELSTAWAAWLQRDIKHSLKENIFTISLCIFFSCFSMHDCTCTCRVRERCLRPPHDAPHAPLVVCLHGLNGSVSSFSQFSQLGAVSQNLSFRSLNFQYSSLP